MLGEREAEFGFGSLCFALVFVVGLVWVLLWWLVWGIFLINSHLAVTEVLQTAWRQAGLSVS